MNWFLQQTRRDQIALLIGGGALLIAALWVILLQPLQDAAAEAKDRYENTEKALARVTDMARQVKEQQQQAQQGARPGQSITQLVFNTTRAVGISQDSLQPQNNDTEARLRFESVDLTRFIKWLYDVEANNQVQVLALQLNASRAPGAVMATVRLRAGN